MDIFRDGSVILKVRPDDNDKCTKKVMGENIVTLTASLSSPFLFQVGDYAMFAGEKYTLNILPKVKKENAFTFVYDLVFEGLEYELRKVHMLFYTANLVYAGGADFSLMGDAELQARVIVENMNRVQSGWTLGSVIATEAKNLTYSGNNCLEAITRIAEEFGTEYWIGTDKTINIGKRGDIIPVTFQYGKNKGLYSIERTNVNSKDIITRLYPFGSEQNLPKGYRNNSKRLQIEGAYIEANTSLYGIIESSQTFEEIKPERTGTISAVNESDVLEFTDSSMDFDINATDEGGNTTVLIPGTTAKIHFQTGDLAGYEFELSSYNHETKTFRLVKFTDEVAYDLPNGTLKPRVGDKYIILDIYMPATYVTDAEARLLAKAQESLEQNSVPNVAYKVEADPIFIKKLGQTYKAGDYVHIEDEDIAVDRDIRIVGIDRNLVNTDIYDFELADTVEPSLATQIITTLEKQDIVIKMNRLNDPARARRNYKVVQELQNAVFDQDGYFDNENIKPFSIETSMLSVGSKGQQFYTDCMFQTNYLGNKNSLLVGNGALSHFTIEDEIRNWTITGLSEILPDDNLRYIFIKCLKVGTTGQVVLSASQLAIDDGTYYNFFAGVLSSVIDNARQVSLLFGFTTINGRFIKTGRIQSADGSTYFDLDTKEIAGKITFIAGSSGYANLTDKPDLSVYALGSYVDTVAAGLQNQIDGVIDSWFYAYTPTTGNYPANEWTTDTLKQRHIGDTFTNTQEYVDDTTTPDAGKSWRWVNNSGVYSWTPIADSDAVKALQAAAAAQDTADGKRRVFTSQPTNTDAYDVGDLWANATYSTTYTNDLLKCKTAKAAGAAFSISHWEKASKYTDDTAANAAATAAANAQTAANNAQTSADTANTLLSDIASDSKLTPVEKQSTKQEWDIIVSEKTKIDAQADVYSVSKTAYGTAYTTLSTYITPLLSDLATTSDIVGTTFRTNFKNYYDARQDILNAISTAAKTLADSIQVGGRNLYTGTWEDDVEMVVAAGIGYRFPISYKMLTELNLAVGDVITISSIISSATGFSTYRSVFAFNNGSTVIYALGSDVSVGSKSVVTATIPAGIVSLSFYYSFENPTGTTFKCKKIKLEKGNRATDWTPAPEDIDVLISTAQTAADNAATAAANAQTSADTANTAIANIASDNVLSASEKSGERSRWNDVANEKSGLNGQATAYSITTENTAYNTAFQNLANYLNAGVTWSSGIPSWLADANLGTNTTIVGSTYRSTWNAYFTARQTLLNAISSKAKTLADAAQTTANSKSRHFIDTPTAPYYVGDTYSNGTTLYRCKTQRLTGSYDESEWELATTFDNTATTIEGGLVTSGTVQVGTGAEGSVYVKAGITGQGSDDTSVRFWAGATFLNRATAPFRVLQNGSMMASAGTIAGWMIDSGKIYKQENDIEVELNSNNKYLRFSYQSQEKTAIFGDVLPALSSLLAPNTGTIYPGSNQTKTADGTYSYLAPSSVTVPTSRITLTTRLEFTEQGGDINITAYLANTSGEKISTLGSFNRTLITSQGSNPYSWVVYANVVAGTYKILYEYTISNLDEYNPGFTIGGSSNSYNTLYYDESRNATLIGRDGIASYWNTSKYFYLSQSASSYFMEGRGGLKWIAPGSTSVYLQLSGSDIIMSGLTTRTTETVYRLFVDANGKVYKRSTSGE